MKKTFLISGLLLLLVIPFMLGYQSSAQAEAPLLDSDGIVQLGKAIFFDADLSANGKQSCAACHAAEVGFTGPDAQINATGAVYQGAIPNRFGNRKPPASAYAGDSFELYQDSEGGWFGGMFWDGRATRLDAARSARRAGAGAVPESAGTGDRQRPGAVCQSQAG